jgi:hypothetical protein
VSNKKAECSPVAKQVLRYFVRNPEAADSLIEIARWRLMQEAVRCSVEDTRTALDWLLSEGYLRREKRAGTESLFQLNLERMDEARSLLDPRSENQSRKA